jgi:hypothetical protein
LPDDTGPRWLSRDALSLGCAGAVADFSHAIAEIDLALTARSQKPDRLRALNLGTADCVTKPFDLEELLARIRAVLRHGSSDDEIALGAVGWPLDAREWPVGARGRRHGGVCRL